MKSDFTDPMDHSLLQLERELQSLTPAAPGRDFIRSLQARMEPVPKTVPFNKAHVSPWRRMVAPAAAAAAAVAVMSVQNNRRQVTVTDTSVADDADTVPSAITWEPMPMRSEYRDLLAKGVDILNHPASNRIMVNRGDSMEWINAADNSRMRLTMPREQRFIVPAGFDGDDYFATRRIPTY